MNATVLGVLSIATLLIAFSSPARAAGGTLSPEITTYLDAREAEFDLISSERRKALAELSQFIETERSAGRAIQLVFVCTHNSRRSHMSQLWAAAAAERYGIDLTTYSGGTEATAFNPRAVASLKRAGFEIEQTTRGSNPIYHVRMGESIQPITCFSKIYNGAPNPSEDYGAVMVCDQADETCPFVVGMAGRFAIPFVDPKVSDNTPAEAETYDARCAQIAREMLYVMSQVG